MKVVELNWKELEGGICSWTGTLVDKPFSWCVEHNIPWVTPHKDIPGPVQWYCSSPFPYFRTFGTPSIEEIEEVSEAEIYDYDLARPHLTADALCLFLLNPKRTLLAATTTNLALLPVLESLAQELCDTPLQELMYKEKWKVVPHSFMSMASSKVDGKYYGSFGFRTSLPERYEVRYWRDADRVERMDSADGMLVVDLSFEEDEKKSKKPKKLNKLIMSRKGWTPVEESRVEFNDSDLDGNFTVHVAPVPWTRTDILIATPLADLDEIMIPRTHLQGHTTSAYLESCLTKTFKKSVTSMDKVAETIGDFIESIEEHLVKALIPPRMIISGKSGETARTWSSPNVEVVPKPCDIQEIHTILAPLTAGMNDAAADWVVNIATRACVIMHSRNVTVFDAQYTSLMFNYGDLMASLMRAGPGDMTDYVTPFLMIGTLDRKKLVFTPRVRKAGGASASPLIGGSL